MTKKRSSKKRAKASRKPSGTPRKIQNHAERKISPSPRVLKPDINVRRSAYAKSARLSVLASAEARQKLIEVGGENTIDVIREFDRDMSDEELARKTGVKASDVRIVLNRLHSCGLFSYTRVRDRDSGWYSYIWKMSEDRLRNFVGGDSLGPQQADGMESTVEGENYLEKNLVMQEQMDGMQQMARRRR